jgi:hypothetical protein
MILRFLARRTFDLTAGDELSAAVTSRASSRAIKMNVPVDLLVMHGAFRFSCGWHPFISALLDGPNVLDAFYKRVRPRNLGEYYRVDGGEDLPPWALPWIGHRPPGPEHDLGLEHGVSYYGPASVEKVSLENRRLHDIAESIRKFGYKPERSVQGHFMKSRDNYRFFIRGGKHRAAAHVFLGGRSILARFREGWPRLVDDDDADNWPMVREGLISAKAARAAFRRYFEFDGTQHAP